MSQRVKKSERKRRQAEREAAFQASLLLPPRPNPIDERLGWVLEWLDEPSRPMTLFEYRRWICPV